MKESIHKGHRERIRQRVLKHGLEGFEDHQVLEFLLFYSVPVKDTNELAHKLLERFGSLAGVLDASPSELGLVDGIGEKSALLLSVLPDIFSRYSNSRNNKKQKVTSISQAGEYAVNLMRGKNYETFYLVGLDIHKKITHAIKISEGTLDEAPAYPRKIVEAALSCNADSVFVVHNHPGGSVLPSDADVKLTSKIKFALAGVDIILQDHIIVADDEYLSFYNMGFLNGKIDIDECLEKARKVNK